MIKIYGMNTCPDCIAVDKHVEGDNRYEVIEIGSHIKYLKEFLRLRDNNAVFDEAKKHGYAGVPCFVLEDGTVTAVGEGLAVILASSNDGHFPATCIVKVDTSTGINIQTIDYPKETQIYNIEGKQLTKLQKGVNIVRIGKGQVRKVIIR